MSLTVLQGDCRTVLRALDAGSVQCCVTSPPYWGLRDYGTKEQIGLEPTPGAYVAEMVQVFREVWRVLRDDGTLWLNLGSSYFGGGGFCATAPSTATSKSGKYGSLGALIKGRAHAVSGDKRPTQSPSDAPACGNDGTGLQDSPSAGSSCPCCGGELQDGFLIRRDYIARISQQTSPASPQPAQTSHDNGHQDCASASQSVSGPAVKRSTTRASFRRDRAACVPSAKASEPPSATQTFAASALPSLDSSACTDDTVQNGRPLAFRTSDTGFFCKACGYCATTLPSFKTKDMIPIPWMVAMALQADGWYLRQDIIWNKPSAMPESVTDRCTKSHEYIFLLTKSAKYFYDQEAIKEAQSPGTFERFGKNPKNTLPGKKSLVHPNGIIRDKATMPDAILDGGRNKRSVWTIATSPYSEAHFATFPPNLIKPCVLAGSKVGDTVLDPFGGSGTTGMVALEYGRKAVLIELNPAYVALCHERCAVTPGLSL